jgi:hypothetical protein
VITRWLDFAKRQKSVKILGSRGKFYRKYHLQRLALFQWKKICLYYDYDDTTVASTVITALTSNIPVEEELQPEVIETNEDPHSEEATAIESQDVLEAEEVTEEKYNDPLGVWGDKRLAIQFGWRKLRQYYSLSKSLRNRQNDALNHTERLQLLKAVSVWKGFALNRKSWKTLVKSKLSSHSASSPIQQTTSLRRLSSVKTNNATAVSPVKDQRIESPIRSLIPLSDDHISPLSPLSDSKPMLNLTSKPYNSDTLEPSPIAQFHLEEKLTVESLGDHGDDYGDGGESLVLQTSSVSSSPSSDSSTLVFDFQDGTETVSSLPGCHEVSPIPISTASFNHEPTTPVLHISPTIQRLSPPEQRRAIVPIPVSRPARKPTSPQLALPPMLVVDTNFTSPTKIFEEKSQLLSTYKESFLRVFDQYRGYKYSSNHSKLLTLERLLKQSVQKKITKMYLEAAHEYWMKTAMLRRLRRWRTRIRLTSNRP